jgi:DNA adenine methylase
MILHRLGNKRSIAEKIYRYFPPHENYIELFFGAGGMFFNKPQAKYNFCNDIDNDVINLWEVVKNSRDKLIKEVSQLPIHQTLLKQCKNKKVDDAILRAAMFLFLSNFSYLGKADTLHVQRANTKDNIIKLIDITFEKIKNVCFLNQDFRNVLNKISWRSESIKQRTFIYADPPYQDTCNNYFSCNKFSKKDLTDLIELCLDSKMNFAISEFKQEYILELVKFYKLHCIEIVGRKTLKHKSKKTEILLTNYKPETTFNF